MKVSDHGIIPKHCCVTNLIKDNHLKFDIIDLNWLDLWNKQIRSRIISISKYLRNFPSNAQ